MRRGIAHVAGIGDSDISHREVVRRFKVETLEARPVDSDVFEQRIFEGAICQAGTCVVAVVGLETHQSPRDGAVEHAEVVSLDLRSITNAVLVVVEGNTVNRHIVGGTLHLHPIQRVIDRQVRQRDVRRIDADRVAGG